MTPSFILLARACESRAQACYIVPRLQLDRPARSRLERLEIDMWQALAPLVGRHAGDRVEIRRRCPDRWRHALDTAMSLPDWMLDAAEQTPDLLTRWVRRGSTGWTLPHARREPPARATPRHLDAAA